VELKRQEEVASTNPASSMPGTTTETAAGARQPDLVVVGDSTRLISLAAVQRELRIGTSTMLELLRVIGVQSQNIGPVPYVELLCLERGLRRWMRAPTTDSRMRRDARLYAGRKDDRLRKNLKSDWESYLRVGGPSAGKR